MGLYININRSVDYSINPQVGDIFVLNEGVKFPSEFPLKEFDSSKLIITGTINHPAWTKHRVFVIGIDGIERMVSVDRLYKFWHKV